MNIREKLMRLLGEGEARKKTPEEKEQDRIKRLANMPTAPVKELVALEDRMSGFCKDVPEVNKFAQSSPESFATTVIFVIGTILKAWPIVTDKFPYLMTFIEAHNGLYKDPRDLIPLDDPSGPKVATVNKEEESMLSLVFGKQGVPQAIHYIWRKRKQFFDEIVPLLKNFNNAQSEKDHDDAAKEIYKALIPLPGIGYPKAGFAAQLLLGKFGCIDSINMQLLPDELKIKYKTLFSKEGGFVSANKIAGTEETLPRYKGAGRDGKDKADLYLELLDDLEKIIGKGAISKLLWDSWCDLVETKMMFPTSKIPVVGLYHNLDKEGNKINPDLPSFPPTMVPSEYGKENSRQFLSQFGSGSGRAVSYTHRKLLDPGKEGYKALVTDPAKFTQKEKEFFARNRIRESILHYLANSNSKENTMDSRLLKIIREELQKVLKEEKELTAKQKELAAKYPPKDKITRGDIIKAATEKKGDKKEEEELDEMSTAGAVAPGKGIEGYAASMGAKKAKKKVLEEDDTIVEYLTEEESKSHPPLGKVTRNPAGSNKKFHVYVKCNGKVKKISFGDPGLSIKRDSPERRKSFRARHKCDKAEGKNRCTARYWACMTWRRGTSVSDMTKEEE